MRDKDVHDAISLERIRQIQKFGKQEHTDEEWLAILAEEVGEVAEAINKGKHKHAKEELVHVAAVAAAALEDDSQGEGIKYEDPKKMPWWKRAFSGIVTDLDP